MNAQVAYAEDAVLAGIVANNDAFHQVSDRITAEHFTTGFRRRVWGALREAVLAGEEIDSILLCEALPDEAAAVLDLCSGMATGRVVESYAKTVHDNWQKREASAIANRLLASLREGEAGAVDSAIASLLNLSSGKRECEFTGVQVMQMALTEAEAAFENGGRLPGITTGLKSLDELLGGWHNSDLTIIGARPAMGKEQPNSSRVLLANGAWLTMGEMCEGLRLASVDGEESVVLGVYPQGVKEVYEFTFSDGRTARAGIDHLWEVMYREWSKPRVLTTKQILTLLKRSRYVKRLSLRLISGRFGGGDLPIDSWLLGVLLGDGNFTTSTPRVTSADQEVLDRIHSLLPDGYTLRQCGKYDWRISGAKGQENFLTAKLKALGLWGKYSHEKRIPNEYLSASYDDRLALMQGLIDSDGWVERFNCIRFAASSIEFAEDVQALARSLGCLCSIRCKATTHRDSYILTIRGNAQQGLAWLKRKAERIRPRSDELRLTIKDVYRVADEECTCIRVSHPTSLYVTDDFVVTHNTALMIGLAEAAADSGITVGMFSAEQPGVQVGLRRLSLASGVGASAIRSGRIAEEQWPRMAEGVRRAKGRNLRIYDRSALTLDELVAVSRKWKHAHGVGALFIDYAQRITVPGADRITEVSTVARGLKNLARDLGIPVISLAQVVKGVDQRANKRPTAGDLANSDELTREADQVLMLYRDEVYARMEGREAKAGIAEILVEKNRHGPTGFVELAFMADTMRFADLAEESW